MSDTLQLIQECDEAALEMEKAKAVVERTKTAWEDAKHHFELARETFEDSLVKSDALGIPKAKMRKLIEERTMALMSSGLLVATDSSVKAPRPPKVPKKAKAPSKTEGDSDEIHLAEDSSKVINFTGH